MKQYRGKTGQPLILEDTSGRPIRVHTLVNVDLSPVTDGSGDYIQNGGTLFYGAATLGHSGAVGVENGGVMTLGDLTSAQDMDLDRISAFESWGTGELQFKQSSAASVDAPLLGDGKVTVYNDMTFARFRKIGGDLQLSQDGTDVILTSPNATLNKIAYYNTGTAVTVNGGRIDGTSSSRAVALIGGISSSFTANEADVRTSSCEVGTIAFNGGRWTMTTSFGNPVGTSTKPQCVCIDGATVQLGDRNDSWGSGFETVLDKSPYRAIYVKSGGMKLQVSNKTGDTHVSVGSFLSGVDGSEPDGGVTVGGFGLMRLDGASWGVTGPVVFNDSLYRTKAQAFAVTGPVTFGTISLSPESESVATTVDFSAGETKVYGSATLQAAHASQSSHGCVRLGRLTREKGGVLFLRDASTTMNFFDGISYNANPAYTVTVPLATNDVNGATRFPVFAYACTRTDGKATSRYNVRFLTCRSDGSFAQVAEKAYAASLGANELALVDNVSGESTVATDQTLAGLTVYGRNGNALSIAENVTLTLGNGLDPAALLLNNSHQSGGGCATVAGGGTLDFGASEGVVAVNQPQSGSIAAVIKCRIAGSGGMTFAGPTVDGCRIQLDGANDYSGGTWVRGVCLAVSKGSGLGNGSVHVDGGDYNGGEIRFAGAESFGNDFFVTGTGVGTTEGVLWFTANATMTGAIVLRGYDRNEVRIGAASRICGTIDGPVSGAARLVVSGAGTVAFGAKNSFGALKIVSGATVVLKEGATLGDGEIVVNGVLRLENTSDLVLGNRLSGSGTVVIAGAAQVEMLDTAGFAGRVIVEGSGTYDMKGQDLTVNELDTDGDYVNTGLDATLTFGGERPATFSGTFDGAVSLVKSGANVQYLTGVSTYSGSTTVEAGTLILGERAVSATLPVTDDILRLDAGTGVTLESGTTRVESWADADGKDIVFRNSNYQELATPNSAILMSNHLNGLPAVHFDHSLIRYAASGVSCGVVTYFNVVNYGHDDAPTAGLDGVFGKGGSDTGVRINGSSYGDAANDWINGVAGSSFVKNETHLFTRENLSALNWEGPAVGDYSPHKRPMSGDIGEIIVYGRALSKTERASVNDYLMLKWGIMEEPVPVKYTNILPSTTALVVSDGATVDLNGNDQTVASLELVGSLVNTSGRGATLTLVGDSTFAPNAIFGAPNLDLVLADGVTLNLGGGTFTIRRLTGCRSQVVNGTLIETHPRGGLLLIVR